MFFEMILWVEQKLKIGTNKQKSTVKTMTLIFEYFKYIFLNKYEIVFFLITIICILENEYYFSL